jgi:hypothetical protein
MNLLHFRTILSATAIAAMVAPACDSHDHATHAHDTGAAASTAPDKVKSTSQHGAHEHSGKHTHGSPHGGSVQTAAGYHVELVAGPGGARVYLLDAGEKTQPVDGVTGTLSIVTETGLKKTPLTVAGDHLRADVEVRGAAVVTLQVGGKVVNVRFGASAPTSAPDSQPAAAVKFDLTTQPAPPKARQVATYTFRFSDAGSGAAITDFDVVHEKQLHVFFVSEDLAFFDHVHPALQPDGSFTLKQRVPHGGSYRVFTDFTTGGQNYLLSAPVTVSGPAGAKVPPLSPSTQKTGTWGPLKTTLALTPEAPTAKVDVTLLFDVADARTGKPVTDLEPYLGALGHMVLLHEDGETYVHAHPQEAKSSDGHAGHDHSGHGHAAPRSGGPEVKFVARFPKPGLYKLWAQLKRKGKVVTVDYVVRVF